MFGYLFLVVFVWFWVIYVIDWLRFLLNIVFDLIFVVEEDLVKNEN